MCLTCLPACTEIRTVIQVFSRNEVKPETSSFRIEDLKSGSDGSCVLLGDGSLRCMGSGKNGNLGRYHGAPHPTLRKIKQVVTGKEFSCVITGEKNEALCFGRNDRGQLGNTAVASSVDPVQVLDSENSNAPLRDVRQLAAGENHACALLLSGRVVCWGDNTFGQVGRADQSGVAVRTIQSDELLVKNITAIFAGYQSTCIVANEKNELYCFGERSDAKNKNTAQLNRIAVSGTTGFLENIRSLSIGQGFICALHLNTQVYCWGKNDLGQLGQWTVGGTHYKAVPVQVRGGVAGVPVAIQKIEAITTGESHVCALEQEDRTVLCWGDNRLGQLGGASVRGLPERVVLGENNLTLNGVRSVAAASSRSCVVSMRDEVFCWGTGGQGQLGNNQPVSIYPMRVLDVNGDALSNVQQVSVGYDHACSLDRAGNIYCFGINEFGQIGSRIFAGPLLDTALKPVNKIKHMDRSGSRTCYIQGDDRALKCFGEGVQSLGLKYGILAVAVGHKQVCVINSARQVDCMGDSKLSTGLILNEEQEPLQDIWQVIAHEDFYCAVTQASGNLYCWGLWRGEEFRHAKKMMQPNRDTGVLHAALSDHQLCAVRGVDRELLCTQTKEEGSVDWTFSPVTDTANRSLKRMVSISAGKRHFCAADDDGILFCWGSNDMGQLGLKLTKEVALATRVLFADPRLKFIHRVSAGDEHTCVLNAQDAVVFCFGKNLFSGSNSPLPLDYTL